MDVNDLNLVNIRQLPHPLQALIDCVGLEHAYRLTCEFGGRAQVHPQTRRTHLAVADSTARCIGRTDQAVCRAGAGNPQGRSLLPPDPHQ